jgi:hypothetical protein
VLPAFEDSTWRSIGFELEGSVSGSTSRMPCQNAMLSKRFRLVNPSRTVVANRLLIRAFTRVSRAIFRPARQ